MKLEMINNLTMLVMKYSYQGKIFDEMFIKEAYDIIINYNKELESMINGNPNFISEFSKTNGNKLIITGASYNLETGNLNFSTEGMKYNLKGELNYSNIKLEELEYYIYMNLGAIRDIIHELEHVRQKNIILNENNDLLKLIKNVEAKKGTFTMDFYKFLMSKGYKEDTIRALMIQLSSNYNLNHDKYPTERAAITKSQKDIYHIAENISYTAHIENLLEYLHNVMHDTTYAGYEFKNGKSVKTPIDLFTNIQTLLGNMYEEFSHQIITSSILKNPTTSEEDIIMYGADVNEEQLKKFIK
jgi:hypothetical protein